MWMFVLGVLVGVSPLVLIMSYVVWQVMKEKDLPA